MMIPTIKKVYGDSFKYDGNRAIVFDIHSEIPTEKLNNCIQMALTYHKYKHLPFLGR